MRSYEYPTSPETDLPTWMRRAMHGNDYGIWLVLLFSLVIAWYFVVGPALPTHTATENHVYRVATYADALREGRLYPRWDPHANGGYGAPIPHYAPPLAAYLSATVEVLITQDTVLAVRLVYAMAFVMGGGGMYGLVLRLRGAGAGVLAALMYMTSPYFGLTSPHLLGDLPGTLALGILPVMLWSVHRLVTIHTPSDYWVATLTGSALLLTAPQVAVAGWVLAALLVIVGGRGGYRLWVLVVGLNTVLIGAMYWLPAVLELEAVRWEVITATQRPLFLTWRDLLRPFTQVDAAALVPQPALMIGWVPLVIMMIGGAWVVFRARRVTVEAVFMCAGGVLAVVAVLVLPSQVWLLGVISLCVSVVSGAALGWQAVSGPAVGRWMLVFGLLVVLWAGQPVWLPPAAVGNLTDTSPAVRVQYEQRGYGVASVPPGDRYPTTLPPTLLLNDNLIGSYLQGNPTYISAASLTDSLTASILAEDTHSSRYQVSSSAGTTLQLLRAYFPGWRAQLNQQMLGTAASDTNLLTVSIPQTEQSRLRVWLGTTRPRQMGWGVAVVGLAMLGWLTRRFYQRGNTHYQDVRLLTTAETRLIGMIWLVGTAVVLFTASPNARYSVRQPANISLTNVEPINSRTTAGLNLIGYELATSQLKVGGQLDVTLYWSTLVPLDETYYVQITLANDDQQFSKQVIRYPGGYPTTRWPTNRFVVDRHYIELPKTLPPGEYLVDVTLQPCSDLAACDEAGPRFFSERGELLGEQLRLPTRLIIAG